jgi:hypothetical protein
VAEIENAEALSGIFGDWPSFHDAEVLRIRLDNHEGEMDEHGRPRKPTLEADIHVFEPTGKVTPEGFSETRNHTVVTLGFEGVADNSIRHFAFQNVLWDLEFEALSAAEFESLRWRVSFSASTGVEATFSCEAVKVVAAEAFGQ